jgi:hypothetical protein
MVFSAGLAGSGEDLGKSVLTDQSGAIFVVGTTRSLDFPTSANALQRTPAGLNCDSFNAPCADAFVTKFSADGQTMMYSTLFGGTNAETVRSAAVDAAGSVHFAGTTWSADLPLRRAIQMTCDNVSQSFYGCSEYIAKLSPSGASLAFATYFGSVGNYAFGLGQFVNCLSVDRDGGLIVTGTTLGNDLPLVRPLLAVNGGGPLFKSTDKGRSWTATGDGISGQGSGFSALAGARRKCSMPRHSIGCFAATIKAAAGSPGPSAASPESGEISPWTRCRRRTSSHWESPGWSEHGRWRRLDESPLRAAIHHSRHPRAVLAVQHLCGDPSWRLS